MGARVFHFFFKSCTVSEYSVVSEYMQYAGHMFLVLVKTSGDICDLRDGVLVNSGSACYDLHRVCSSGYSAFISVLYVRIYCQNGNKDMFIKSILYPGATLSSHQCLVNSSTSVRCTHLHYKAAT